jgi:hypothetical protein
MARQVSVGEAAMQEVIRRAERRRTFRRVGGAVLALAIAGGGISLAFATFRPSEPSVPAAGPTPGPTPTSDDATPAAIPVEIANASTDPRVPPFVESLLEARGRGVHHGGYQVIVISETEGSEVTAVLHDPGLEAEAQRIVDRVLPGATVRPDAIPGGAPLRIVVGADFVESQAEALAAFEFVGRFGEARSTADRADLFLAEPAATYYHGNDVGSLYGYAKGCPYEVRVTEEASAEPGYEFYLAFCKDEAESWTERVRVDTVDGELLIVEAMLIVVTTNG